MTQSLARKDVGLIDVLGTTDKLKRYRTTIENCLPAQMRSDAGRYWLVYAKIAQDLVANPAITDKMSVLTCMFNAVKLGLSPDPVFGHIYFIPYAGVLTYQIGYKGMVRLSLNTCDITSVRTGLVYEKDGWEYSEDEHGQHFRHVPNFSVEPGKDNPERLAYSIFQSKDGIDIHVMPSYHIDKIKKMVLARTPKSPWANELFEPEMRKKTCLRRHWKLMPMSPEVARVMECEERLERGDVSGFKIAHPELEEVLPKSAITGDTAEENPLSVFDREPGKQES